MRAPILKKKAFTLIEIVIALALGALILVASSSLLMSITQLWIKEGRLDNFQGHVHGVKTFLQTHLNGSYYRINDKLPTVQWSSPPQIHSGINETFLSFYIYTPNPLFPVESLSPVICYLNVDKKNGLSIIWHSFESISLGKEVEVYQTGLSPWAKDLKLHYYDTSMNTWEVLDSPKEDKVGKLELPDLLELKFSKEGEEDQSSFILLYRDHKPTEVIL